MFRDDDNKATINETNLLEAKDDLTLLNTIFEETEEVKQEQLNIVDQRLSEIEKKRKETLLRRDQVKMERLGITKKKQRRSMGKMG